MKQSWKVYYTVRDDARTGQIELLDRTVSRLPLYSIGCNNIGTVPGAVLLIL